MDDDDRQTSSKALESIHLCSRPSLADASLYSPPPIDSLPILPLQVAVLSPSSTSLVVPTSCPHELEFPYSLATPINYALDPMASAQVLPMWLPSVEEQLAFEKDM